MYSRISRVVWPFLLALTLASWAAVLQGSDPPFTTKPQQRHSENAKGNMYPLP